MVAMTADDTAAQLDALVTRLERVAEQLRSGDVSPDAAATLVGDAGALASHASAAPRGAPRPPPLAAPRGARSPPPPPGGRAAPRPGSAALSSAGIVVYP